MYVAHHTRRYLNIDRGNSVPRNIQGSDTHRLHL